MNSDRPTPSHLNTRETTNICRRKPTRFTELNRLAVALADEPLARRGALRARPVECVGLLDHVAAEQVFARRVDDVQEQRRARAMSSR